MYRCKTCGSKYIYGYGKLVEEYTIEKPTKKGSYPTKRIIEEGVRDEYWACGECAEENKSFEEIAEWSDD